MADIYARFRVKQDTGANWSTNNSILLQGEIGLETDGRQRMKVGDGITAWNDLPWRVDQVYTPTDVTTLAGAEQSANKGAANGYAPLGADQYIPENYLPPTAKSSKVVADITARDAILAEDRFEGLRVHVIDGSADASVVAGSAGYILKAGLTDTDWSKVYEGESLDLDLTVYVEKATLGDNSLVKADVAGTPVGLTIPNNTLVGRTSGSITPLNPVDVRTLINVEDGADVTDHTNVDSAGAVMESDFASNQVMSSTTAGTVVGVTVNPSTFVGRQATGNIASLTPVESRTILNVEDGADVTDAENVRAAGAVMGGDVIIGGSATT